MPFSQTTSIAHLETDPLRNFKFLVDITANSGGYSSAASGITLSLGFMSVSGLNVNISVIAYREGGMNALPVDTPVLTTAGWKPMGAIQEGDQVVDPDGQPSKVTGVYPRGVRPVYRVTLADGRSVLADAEHLWETETVNHRTRRTLNTAQLRDALARGKGVRLIGMQPAQYEALSDLPLDPYVLGVLISEGALSTGNSVRFAQDPGNTDMLARVRAALPAGHRLNSRTDSRGGADHRVVGPEGGGNGTNLVLNAVRDLGLLGHRAWEKFIPEAYMFASVEDRLALLQGIMDGDGSIQHRNDPGKAAGTRIRITYSSASQRLRDDVAALIRSLGGQCTTGVSENVKYTSPAQKTPKAARDAYVIRSVQMPLNPFYMTSKASVFKPQAGSAQRKVASVEPAGEADVQCISVSADSQCYIIQHFIPTHNTTTQKLPGQADFSPIVLTRGVAVGDSQDIAWLKQLFQVIQGSNGSVAGTDFRQTVDVRVLSHPITSASAPVSAWFRIYNAWPTAVAYSDLDAGTNQLLISQLTLAHEGWDYELATSDTTDAPVPGTATNIQGITAASAA